MPAIPTSGRSRLRRQPGLIAMPAGCRGNRRATPTGPDESWTFAALALIGLVVARGAVAAGRVRNRISATRHRRSFTGQTRG